MEIAPEEKCMPGVICSISHSLEKSLINPTYLPLCSYLEEFSRREGFGESLLMDNISVNSKDLGKT